jgi:hypothetical protein
MDMILYFLLSLAKLVGQMYLHYTKIHFFIYNNGETGQSFFSFSDTFLLLFFFILYLHCEKWASRKHFFTDLFI